MLHGRARCDGAFSQGRVLGDATPARACVRSQAGRRNTRNRRSSLADRQTAAAAAAEALPGGMSGILPGAARTPNQPGGLRADTATDHAGVPTTTDVRGRRRLGAGRALMVADTGGKRALTGRH